MTPASSTRRCVSRGSGSSPGASSLRPRHGWCALRDGALEHTDGPYLDSKEHIGGFWILDVVDVDAAQVWADRATIACQGAVEVRPFQV